MVSTIGLSSSRASGMFLEPKARMKKKRDGANGPCHLPWLGSVEVS